MVVTLLGMVTLVKLSAVRERPVTDGGDVVADGHTDQIVAARERFVPDGNDAVGYGHTGQVVAVRERPVLHGNDGKIRQQIRDAYITAGPGMTEQYACCITVVSVVVAIYLSCPDCRRPGGKLTAPAACAGNIINSRIAGVKHITADRCRTITPEINAGQAAAVFKRRVPDIGDAIANGHTGQAVATIKRIASDASDAVWYGHNGQAVAAIKRIAPDASDAVRYGYASQAVAVRERPVSDASDAVADGHTGQVAAVTEH